MSDIPVRKISDSMPNDAGRFSIRSLEAILNGKPMEDELHRHNYFFILVFEKGKGRHTIDFVDYPVVDQAVFMLRPGQIHQLKMTEDCSGYLLQFDAEFYTPADPKAKQRFRRGTAKNYCQPEEPRFQKLYSVLVPIFREYTAKQADYLDVIRANLDIFFIEFLRQDGGSGQNSSTDMSYEQEQFEVFTELLEHYFTEHKSVIEYAEMLGISVYQLNKITKQLIGKTVSETITDQLTLEAKRYLLGTPNQVKDIAYSLGFEDVSYFIRFFKKQTGYSPEAFRTRSM